VTRDSFPSAERIFPSLSTRRICELDKSSSLTLRLDSPLPKILRFSIRKTGLLQFHNGLESLSPFWQMAFSRTPPNVTLSLQIFLLNVSLLNEQFPGEGPEFPSHGNPLRFVVVSFFPSEKVSPTRAIR